MREVSNITDFFIICSAKSSRQVKAITDYIVEKLKRGGQKIQHIEGAQYALWVLLDCGNVVIHLFTTAVRYFYGLERLWGDAPQINIKEVESRKQQTQLRIYNCP